MLKPNKQEQGFILAMARELLVHNPNVKSVEQAINMAKELISQSHTHMEKQNDRVAKG